MKTIYYNPVNENGGCVIRSISKALNKDYNLIKKDLGIDYNDEYIFESYLFKKGFIIVDSFKGKLLKDVNLNGVNTKANLISRSIAKNNSCQEFVSELIGNNKSFGHIECDAIIMDNAKVSSTPKIIANNVDAELTHEAAIGKISGEQLLKLETLGLTKEEAEAEIIKGFMK